jgi:hypothetical protein
LLSPEVVLVQDHFLANLHLQVVVLVVFFKEVDIQ